MANKGVSEGFGSTVPFSEPHWYNGAMSTSPFYHAKHHAFRAKMRAFVESELIPRVEEWDTSGVFDKSVLRKAYEAGVFSPHWPESQGGTPPEGGFDSFMDLIWVDELMRCGASGVTQCFGIRDMALPPLANLGTQDRALTERIVREVVTGQKMIALCISEPSAGSDVASLQTSLEDSGDGEWILNGEKKWITCAAYSDYFTVACKTQNPSKPGGKKGISLALVERDRAGVDVRRMKMQGSVQPPFNPHLTPI